MLNGHADMSVRVGVCVRHFEHTEEKTGLLSTRVLVRACVCVFHVVYCVGGAALLHCVFVFVHGFSE